MYGDIKSVDLNTLVARTKYVKKNNEHVRTRTFVCTAFLSNPGSNVGSLRNVCLELEMIAKRQTADVSFHRVCETVTIICLNTL